MLLGLLAMLTPSFEEPKWIEFQGTRGPGVGKHIVLLAGDEEYRSEQALPQLAKILAERHGFRCTVLFSLNAEGEIDPNSSSVQPGLHHLQTADLCIMMLRFRAWPEADMKHFVDYWRAGKPIIAIRTSTHAFNYPSNSTNVYRRFGWNNSEWTGGFGEMILGETWISHWGNHGSQATRGIVEPDKRNHPVLRGVGTLFGTTDVYEASPTSDAEILVRGQVVEGMKPTDPPAQGRKKTASGKEQPLNNPMMPIVWTRNVFNDVKKGNRILTITMGSSTDFLDENLRRLVVNGSYWMTGLEGRLPDRADVRIVGAYEPTPFGFDKFKKGVRPADLQAGSK